jgi:glycosyltransferase involved in cell wall biosynthesis
MAGEEAYMADRPWFSVVIPFYNAEKYIEAAVCSVTGQTFSDIEVILVDDASSDGSHGIAAGLAEKDRRVTLITLDENRGAAEARNEGVRHAHGRYLMFLDADDVYEPGLMQYLRTVLGSSVYRNKVQGSKGFGNIASENDALGNSANGSRSRACGNDAPGNSANGSKGCDNDLSGSIWPEVIVWGVLQEEYLPNNRVKTIRVVPDAKTCSSEEELRKEIMGLERRELYGYLWNKAYLTDVFKERGVVIPTQSFNEDEMANIAFFEHASSALFIPIAFTRYRRRREGSLTHRYLGDYYEIAMRRVEALLRQQARWKLYDASCRKALSDMLLRYDLSALMRVADRRCALTHYEKRRMVRHMRTGPLGRELLKDASPDSRILRLLAAWLEDGRIERCLLLGRAAWFVRTRLPGIYGRFAGV